MGKGARNRTLSITAVAALGVVACSGIAEVEVYEVVRTGTPATVSRGLQRDAFNLGDASLVVFPIETSERVTWIIGPLVVIPVFEERRLIDKRLEMRMQLSLELAHGTATVDFSKAALSMGERTLYPFSIVRQWSERIEGRAVTLTGQGPHTFQLHYDIRTIELAPFTLELPPMQVNGREVRLDPIIFRRAKRTVTRL